MTDARTPRKLVVIVPAYNEQEGIAQAINAIADSTRTKLPPHLTCAVYVVNDGSNDQTAKTAVAGGADRVVNHQTNQGLGAAVRSGLLAAYTDGADIVVKFDADLQHDPDDIPALIKPILEDEADLVYGNRFERIEYRMPPVRRVGNLVFTKLMSWLTEWPVTDSQPGIFAVGRPYLQRFYLPGDYNYTQQVLLDAYHKGMRFAHVPVAFRPRETGQSFVSLRYPFKVLLQIFLLLTTLKPLRVFAPLGLAFMLLAGGILTWDFGHWLSGVYTQPAQHVNAILGFGLFGVQTLFFGVLGHLIIQQGKP